MKTKLDILRKIVDSSGYPALPHQNQELLHEFYTHEGLSMYDLIRLVEKNQPLSRSVLKSVNSPLFNPDHPVAEVKNAVMLLGAESVCNIAVYNMMIEFFPPKKLPGQIFDVAIFWRHLVAVAITADKIGKILHHEDIFRLFTYGLLHDIGIIIIDACIPELMDEILAKVKEGMNHTLAEKLVLGGLTHSQIGSWICIEWGLGPILTNITEFHHTPLAAQNPSRDLKILAIAEIIGERYYDSLMHFPSPEILIDETIVNELGLSYLELSSIEQELPIWVENFINPYKVQQEPENEENTAEQ